MIAEALALPPDPDVQVLGEAVGVLGFSVVMASGILGSLAGGWILARLSVRRMMLLFAVFVSLLALRLILQGLGVGGLDPIWPGEPGMAGFLGVGFASGVLSGLFGVGAPL